MENESIFCNFSDKDVGIYYRTVRRQQIELKDELQKRGYAVWADPSCPGKVRIFKDERKDI